MKLVLRSTYIRNLETRLLSLHSFLKGRGRKAVEVLEMLGKYEDTKRELEIQKSYEEHELALEAG